MVWITRHYIDISYIKPPQNQNNVVSDSDKHEEIIRSQNKRTQI